MSVEKKLKQEIDDLEEELYNYKSEMSTETIRIKQKLSKNLNNLKGRSNSSKSKFEEIIGLMEKQKISLKTDIKQLKEKIDQIQNQRENNDRLCLSKEELARKIKEKRAKLAMQKKKIKPFIF